MSFIKKIKKNFLFFLLFIISLLLSYYVFFSYKINLNNENEIKNLQSLVNNKKDIYAKQQKQLNVFYDKFDSNLKIQNILVLLENLADSNKIKINIDFNNIKYDIEDFNSNNIDLKNKDITFKQINAFNIQNVKILLVPIEVFGNYYDLNNFIKDLEINNEIKIKNINQMYYYDINNDISHANILLLFYYRNV